NLRASPGRSPDEPVGLPVSTAAADLSRTGSINMSKDLAANLGVLGVEVMTLQSERLLHLADERLAYLRHRPRSRAARFHRGLAEGSLGDRGLVEQIEQLEVRADVEGEAVIGDPAIHGDPDRRDPGRAREDAGKIRSGRAGQIEFSQGAENGLVQPFDIGLDR